MSSEFRQHWTLNFITDFFSSIRRVLFFNAILIIIDKYTKYARYISARMNWTIENLIDFLIEEICQTETIMISWFGRSIVCPVPADLSYGKISFLLDRAEQYQSSLLLTGLGSKSLLLIEQSVRQNLHQIQNARLSNYRSRDSVYQQLLIKLLLSSASATRLQHDFSFSNRWVNEVLKLNLRAVSTLLCQLSTKRLNILIVNDEICLQQQST
jgi:hypothetical protein